MAELQMYEEVLNVALRQTLKDCGFTRKTRRDYVQERPGRIWYFEVEMEPKMGFGFRADAAVFVPELDAILERYAPGFAGKHAPTRNKATVRASLRRLAEIKQGVRFYPLLKQPIYPEEGLDSVQGWRSNSIYYFQENHDWTLPKYHETLDNSREQAIADNERGVRELGLFLENLWRTQAWPWYHKCDDPMFMVHWIETEDPHGLRTDCSLAVLYHMAGNVDRARFHLQRRIEEGSVTYEELYAEFYRKERGNWLQRLWGGGWSEEKVAEFSKGRLSGLRRTADAARKLADGFGIRLD